jgi:hypothetical protein
MESFKNVASRIARLPHRTRVALICAVLDRVIPVWEQNYSGYSDALRAIEEPVWRFARGLSVDIKDVIKLEEALSKVIPNMSENPEHQPATFAGVTGICALKAISDTSGREAREAVLSSVSAVTTLAEKDFDEIEKREMEWHEHALQVAEEWGSRPVDDSLLTAMKSG